MFGGVGDGRHMLQTLIGICELEEKHEKLKRTYHLAVNDIHKCAIARDLIIWPSYRVDVDIHWWCYVPLC